MSYYGSFPPGSYRVVAAHADGWVLVERTERSDSTWVSLKLVWAGEGTKRKANFWLGWHRAKRTMASVRDWWTLKENYPELAEWLVEAMEEDGVV